MTTYKFATRNFLGKIARCYEVKVKSLPKGAPTKPRVGHHVLVVDASGSMYGDIGDVKEKIRKMLTLDEYRDSEMLVSLLSYSSSGDLVEHFARVPVADIVKSRNTKAQREIGSLRARGATCVTQGLAAALKLAQGGDKSELVAVSLHTDGYFNDPSPSAEFRKVDSLVEEFKKLDNVFVNTIGYRDWCDFKILEKIANALSGKCWQARDVKTFYDSIYDTTQVLSGQTAPALCLEKRGGFDYQVFVSSCGKVVGGAADLKICGVKGDSDRTVYEFREVGEADYKASKVPEVPVQAMFAFAKAQLAEGRVSAAKYALVATRAGGLVEKHAKAVAARDLADFSADLEQAVFAPPSNFSFTKDYGVANAGEATLPRILSILEAHRGDFLLDVRALAKGYRRRGLKRVAGAWQGGKLVKPGVRTELRDADDLVPVSRFEFNRNNATVNMMVQQPCRLLRSDGTEVREAAGIKLKLSDYKQYTIVGDGQSCVPKLSIRVTSKSLHKKLSECGAVGGEFDPKAIVEVDLLSRPLVEYAAKFDSAKYAGVGERLALAHAVDKLLGALSKDSSVDYSDAQVEELRKLCITPKLYVSMPSANPYTDLQKAVADGEVDVRLSYEVLVGSRDFVDPSDLYSANEFLARWYECEGVKDAKKPKVTECLGVSAKHKKLSARVKVGPVDRLMARVFDEFLGLAKTGLFEQACGQKIGKKLYKVFEKKLRGDEAVEVLAEAREAAAQALDSIYRSEVSPLVFFVGSSGLLPDSFGEVSALTSEQLLAKYPDAQVDKKMRDEGSFYDVGGGTIVTVVVRQEYFSTERGVEAAKKLEAGAVEVAVAA